MESTRLHRAKYYSWDNKKNKNYPFIRWWSGLDEAKHLAFGDEGTASSSIPSYILMIDNYFIFTKSNKI